MRLNKRTKLLILAACTIIVITILVPVIGKIGNSKFAYELVNYLRGYSVVIDNQSDYDIVSIETGIETSSTLGESTEGLTKDTFEQMIKSKETKRITPNLSLSGRVGSVYLKYIDSRGNTTIKTVCSYTESLSGHSKVIITNSNVKVEEKCY